MFKGAASHFGTCESAHSCCFVLFYTGFLLADSHTHTHVRLTQRERDREIERENTPTHTHAHTGRHKHANTCEHTHTQPANKPDEVQSACVTMPVSIPTDAGPAESFQELLSQPQRVKEVGHSTVGPSGNAQLYKDRHCCWRKTDIVRMFCRLLLTWMFSKRRRQS